MTTHHEFFARHPPDRKAEAAWTEAQTQMLRIVTQEATVRHGTDITVVCRNRLDNRLLQSKFPSISAAKTWAQNWAKAKQKDSP